MTDISKLRELLERVESATGRDCELDRDISKELFGEPSLSPITSSIDVAISLCAHVLPGWSLRLSLSEGYKFPCISMGRSYPTNMSVAVEHRTTPLAICSAMLRAEIAMLEKEEA